MARSQAAGKQLRLGAFADAGWPEQDKAIWEHRFSSRAFAERRASFEPGPPSALRFHFPSHQSRARSAPSFSKQQVRLRARPGLLLAQGPPGSARRQGRNWQLLVIFWL